MEQYNRNDAEAVSIRKKIAQLQTMNEDIVINDVISIEDVRRFEEQQNIKLPQDYVWFITNVGNGGTWDDGMRPFYPLADTYYSSEALPDHKWGEERFALDVLSKGCTDSIGLFLKGEHYGDISSDCEGLAHYHPHRVHGFKEFYIKWLDEALLGYSSLFVQYRHYGTIEENLEEYRSCHDIDLLYSIIQKIISPDGFEQFTQDVHDCFVSETTNENKIVLMHILKKLGYDDMFSLLKEVFIPENYDTIISDLYFGLYFAEKWDLDKIVKDAGKYYTMLVSIMNHHEYLKERKNFERCFKMTVINPRFWAEDIIGVLTSDDEEIVKYLATWVDQKELLDRVGQYVEMAKEKYNKA